MSLYDYRNNEGEQKKRASQKGCRGGIYDASPLRMPCRKRTGVINAASTSVTGFFYQRRSSLSLILICLLMFACSACTSVAGSGSSTGIAIVAAENFYADIAKQVGGSHVSVISFLSDPNADPHQYESSVQDALAVSNARLVIENGAGYDAWMDKLLAAAPSDARTVLVATNIAPTRLPDNPHVWYDISNVATLAQHINVALKKIDSQHATDYDHNLQAFLTSLNPVRQKMAEVKARYAQTPVGLTENIYLYQALPLGLNVLTPIEFQKAIAEGNDPPADTVVTANNQINSHQIKVLLYNEQTVTPITTNLQNAAKRQHIPIVPVTETMPQGKTYAQWMLDQLDQLEQALQGA